jgi:predicted XRE-type DNA-binding protein
MRSWKEIRPEVVTDPDRVAASREKLDAEVRAYRLAEIRKEQDLTQAEVADIIGITQPNVSRLESGGLDSAALSTVRAYVEALGGKLCMVADFGDRQLRIQ